MSIHRVALAGKGRIGTPTLLELVKAGFDVTVLTRSATSIPGIPSGVQVREVDYDSDESLQKALQNQDALVATVAMSAIPSQRRLIDAAIAAGVKHYIPAEYSVSTRDPKAQWMPLYATVLDIQRYLATREKEIAWTVVQCGALLEFSLDVNYVLDFDKNVATLYDGGNNAVSLSVCETVGKAIASLLRQPERVKDHVVHVHGGVITQNEALEIARRYSERPWTVQEEDADAEIEKAKATLESGATGPALFEALLKMMAAATFANGHFQAAYVDNADNEWLGVPMFSPGEIDEHIRKRIVEGPWGARTSTAEEENLADVADGLNSKYNEGKK